MKELTVKIFKSEKKLKKVLYTLKGGQVCYLKKEDKFVEVIKTSNNIAYFGLVFFKEIDNPFKNEEVDFYIHLSEEDKKELFYKFYHKYSHVRACLIKDPTRL